MTRPGGKPIRASVVALAVLAAIAVVAPAAPAAAPSSPGTAGTTTTAGSLGATAAMAATVHQLRGCLSGLAHSDRRLLTLRFGVGGKPVLTDAQVAAQVPPLTPADVTSRVSVAVRRLAIVHRFGGCRSNSGKVVATAASSTALAAPRAAIVSPLGGHHSGGGLAVGELIAIVVIVACVLVALREFRNVLFPPIPKG